MRTKTVVCITQGSGCMILIREKLAPHCMRLIDSSRLFKTLQDSSRLFKTLQDSSRLFKTLQDSSRLFKTLQDSSRLVQRWAEVP